MIPRLGFGTWRLEGRECEEGVADALAAGYRHVDTAAAYGNEEAVGRGLRASGVHRDELWLTTKVRARRPRARAGARLTRGIVAAARRRPRGADPDDPVIREPRPMARRRPRSRSAG